VKNKLFSKLFISLSLVVMFSMATFNYFINPYKVFNHNYFSSYIKTRDHQASHRMTLFYSAVYQNPESLLIGTSRMGILPISEPKKYMPNKLFNMWMPGGTIEEQTHLIKYMIAKFNIKEIVWSLDFHSFNPELANDPNFSYNRVDPNAIYKDDYNLALFGYQTTFNSIKTLKDNLKNFKLNHKTTSKQKIEKSLKTKKQTVTLGNGWDEKVNSISNDEIDIQTKKQLIHYPEKYLRYRTFNNPKSIQSNLTKVEEIINICKKKNIKLHVYTSPVSQSFLNLYKEIGLQNTFVAWKKDLSKVTSYTDFCTLNSITKEKYNFLDGSHLKPSLGYLIYARLFHDNSVNIPNDFGIFIEKKN